MQRIQHRPMSPDVLTLDGKQLHYKLPIGAISSIANRVSGIGLSVGMPLLCLMTSLLIRVCRSLTPVLTHDTTFEPITGIF